MSPLSVALEWVVEYRPVWLRDRQIFRRRSIALIQRLLTYIVLIDICFVFLIPVFYILSTSLKTAQDLTDPTILLDSAQLPLVHLSAGVPFDGVHPLVEQ